MALRLSVRLFFHRHSGSFTLYSYLQLFRIYNAFMLAFRTKKRKILQNCIFSYFHPGLASADRAYHPFVLHITAPFLLFLQSLLTIFIRKLTSCTMINYNTKNSAVPDLTCQNQCFVIKPMF